MGGFLIQASYNFLTSNTCRGFLYPPESIVALSNNLKKNSSPVILFRKAMTLRGQTVHWIAAQFCVCMLLDSIDKPLNMFQKVSGFHLQKFRGFRATVSGFHKM